MTRDDDRYSTMFGHLPPMVRAEVMRRLDPTLDALRDEAEFENLTAEDEDVDAHVLLVDILVAHEVERELARHRMVPTRQTRQTTTSRTEESGERGSTADRPQGILDRARDELRVARASLAVKQQAGTATAEDQRAVGRLTARVRILGGR